MGQQQLLLLVLGIVIIGLATVAGIEAFQENSRKSSMDNMTSMAVGYAGKMVEWKLKPGAQGGGHGKADFQGFTVANFGMEGGQTLNFLGTSSSNWGEIGGLYVSLWEENQANSATHVVVHDPKYDTSIGVFVYGPEPACFVHRISEMRDGTRVDTPTMWPENPDPANCSF